MVGCFLNRKVGEIVLKPEAVTLENDPGQGAIDALAGLRHSTCPPPRPIKGPSAERSAGHAPPNTTGGFDHDDFAAGFENPLRFGKESRGIVQVAKGVDHENAADGIGIEGHACGREGQVVRGQRQIIGANNRRGHLFEIASARTQFNFHPLGETFHFNDELFVPFPVKLPEERIGQYPFSIGEGILNGFGGSVVRIVFSHRGATWHILRDRITNRANPFYCAILVSENRLEQLHVFFIARNFGSFFLLMTAQNTVILTKTYNDMNPTNPKTALVAGATGLIGHQLVNQLLQSDFYSEVRVLVRKPTNKQAPKLIEILYDYNQPDLSQVQGDDVFCCLGTTMKKAGSKEAFIQVDHDYPLQIARAAKQNGAMQYLIVTAMGADPSSSFFYNRVKVKYE